MKRVRYVDPRLAALKAQADEYGAKYKETLWARAKEKAGFILLQCVRRTLSRSPLTENEVIAHKVEMESYRRRIVELREALARARSALADRKRELSSNGARGA